MTLSPKRLSWNAVEAHPVCWGPHVTSRSWPQQQATPGLWAPHLGIPPPPPPPGQSLTCDEGPRCRHVHDGVVAHRPRLRREHEVVQPTSLPHLLLDPGAQAAALPGSVPEPQRVPDGPQQHRSLKLLHICPWLRAADVLLCL